MRCIAHPDAAAFLRATVASRAADRLFTNPITTNAVPRAEAGLEPTTDEWWLQALDDAGGTIGVAMRIPPRPLLLSSMTAEAAECVVDFVAADGLDLVGVDGPRATATAAAQRYATVRHCRLRRGMAQRLLATDTIIPPDRIGGYPRPATPDDFDLVFAWASAFTDEAVPGHAGPDRDALRRRLAGEPLIALWTVEGQARSLCWRSSAATGVVRISAVYTPPEHRGHGYASANVAAISQAALDGGADTCMLYTDESNATSNKIYERIGYRFVGDADEWLFEPVSAVQPPVGEAG
jgi:uncharacterized protein